MDEKEPWIRMETVWASAASALLTFVATTLYWKSPEWSDREERERVVEIGRESESGGETERGRGVGRESRGDQSGRRGESGEERLTRETVRRILEREVAAMEPCGSGSEKARVHVEFEIEETGEAGDVSVVDRTYRETRVGRCVVEQVKGMEFSEEAAGEIVHYRMPVRVERASVDAGGSGAVSEGPSREQVLETIRASEGEIRRCGTANGMEGTANVYVKFEIRPNGETRDPRVTDEQYRGTEVGRCVVEVVREMRFPTSREGQPVKFPFRVGGNSKF